MLHILQPSIPPPPHAPTPPLWLICLHIPPSPPYPTYSHHSKKRMYIAIFRGVRAPLPQRPFCPFAMAKGVAKRKAPALPVVKDPSGKKRLLTNEALVSTKLRDNFKNLSSASTDAVRGIDGRTLRERLLHDVEMAQKVGESIVFGKL